MTDVPDTHAVILAAGASTRMGQPKAILKTPDNVPGTTLLDAHIHAFMPFCQRILVVVGAHAEAIQSTVNLPVEIIANPDWNRGHMTDSLQLALAQLPTHDWVFVTPVDAPPSRFSWLQALLSAKAPAVPAHVNQRGHPVLAPVGPIHQAIRHATLAHALQGAETIQLPDNECTLNLNSPQDWAEWLNGFSADR